MGKFYDLAYGIFCFFVVYFHPLFNLLTIIFLEHSPYALIPFLLKYPSNNNKNSPPKSKPIILVAFSVNWTFLLLLAAAIMQILVNEYNLPLRGLGIVLGGDGAK